MSRLPRVASYYEHRLGRNDGNPLYVTNCFKTHYAGKIEFQHLVPDPTALHDIFRGYDLHLWVDWAEDALYTEGLLPYKIVLPPRPNAYWVSDSHLGYEYRKEAAKRFDYVFVAQRDAVERFKADGVQGRVEWLPHAVEPDVYNPLSQYTGTPALRESALTARPLRQHDVGFVGFLTFPNRMTFLDTLYKELAARNITTWHASRFFEEAARVYTRSRIGLNHAVKNDLNMRVFEIMATRTFLLTPLVPDLLDLFEDGKHLVTYENENVADALEKITYWLAPEREDEREAIAEAGYREVLARHTFAHRVARILEVGGIHV